MEVGEEVAKITTDPNTGEDVLEITSQRVLDKTGDMDPADAAELITDLKSNPKMLVEFNKNPGLVDGWKKLKDQGFSEAIRKRTGELFNEDIEPKVELKDGEAIDGRDVELTTDWNGQEITERFNVIQNPETGKLQFRFKNYTPKGQ